jgi:hypothetical protein
MSLVAAKEIAYPLHANASCPQQSHAMAHSDSGRLIESRLCVQRARRPSLQNYQYGNFIAVIKPDILAVQERDRQGPRTSSSHLSALRWTVAIPARCCCSNQTPNLVGPQRWRRPLGPHRRNRHLGRCGPRARRLQQVCVRHAPMKVCEGVNGPLRPAGRRVRSRTCPEPVEGVLVG